MKQVASTVLAVMLAVLAGAAGANCVTDTSQADFQAGVASNLDLTTSSGNVQLASTGSGGGGNVDQQNLATSQYGDIYNDTQWLAQTFRAGASGSLTRVDVNLACAFCSGTTSSMIVSIRATSGGEPSGSDLASATIPFIAADGTYAFYSANFTAPPTVSSGTTYAIVLRQATAYTSGKTIWTDSALNGSQGNNSYANGALYLSANRGSSWSARVLSDGVSVDAVFKTYVGGGSSGYMSAGDLISSLKDSSPPNGATPTWSTLLWSSSVPSGTVLQFQAAASNSSNGPFNYVGPNGTSSSYFTSSNQSLSQFDGYRYLKYRAYLSTSKSSSTPVLSDASVCFSSIVNTSADTSITVSDGATTAVPGTQVVYTIKASNAGPDNVTKATVSDAFQAPLTACHWTCTGAGGGTCQSSGSGNIGDTNASLPVGASATYTATCTLPTSATGTVANTATITATAPSGITDPVSGNNSATDTDTLTPQADLSVTNSDGQTTQIAGLSTTYNIQVQNPGPSDAPNSHVTDAFPSTLTCNWTCSVTGGASCPASGSGNINTGVNLPKGGRTTFLATCSLASSASGTVTNTASAAPPAGVSDTNNTNNSATDSDSVTIRPDVALTMTDNQDNVQIGTPVDYVMRVTNLGPSDAVLNLTDNLPPQLSKMASWVCTGSGGATCSKGNGNTMDTNATVPVGGVATYVYSSTVISDDAGNSFSNVAVAHVNNGSDPNGANNSATDTDTIVVFLDNFEGDGATTAMKLTGGGGGASMTTQLGVDGGLLNNLGPAPVTVATGRSDSGKKLFSLQLMRLGGDVMMRVLTPIDDTQFSEISPWQTVDLRQHLLGLQWQPASGSGDDGYLRAGSAMQQALVSASNAPENLTRLQVRVENDIPWLVPVEPPELP